PVPTGRQFRGPRRRTGQHLLPAGFSSEPAWRSSQSSGEYLATLEGRALRPFPASGSDPAGRHRRTRRSRPEFALILRPAGRPPIPVGGRPAGRFTRQRFSSSAPWTQGSAAPRRVDRSDPTTSDILAVAAGTYPVGRRLDTPLQQLIVHDLRPGFEISRSDHWSLVPGPGRSSR